MVDAHFIASTHFSSFCVVLLLVGPLVVFRLLMAFNHLDFMLPLDDDDSFLSRAFDSVASSLDANRSFWKYKTKTNRLAAVCHLVSAEYTQN